MVDRKSAKDNNYQFFTLEYLRAGVPNSNGVMYSKEYSKEYLKPIGNLFGMPVIQDLDSSGSANKPGFRLVSNHKSARSISAMLELAAKTVKPVSQDFYASVGPALDAMIRTAWCGVATTCGFEEQPPLSIDTLKESIAKLRELPKPQSEIRLSENSVQLQIDQILADRVVECLNMHGTLKRVGTHIYLTLDTTGPSQPIVKILKSRIGWAGFTFSVVTNSGWRYE